MSSVSILWLMDTVELIIKRASVKSELFIVIVFIQQRGAWKLFVKFIRTVLALFEVFVFK